MMTVSFSFPESLARFVNHSKDILVQDAARSFGFYFRREHSSLFDRFYNYLSNTMLTGNTDDLTDEFHHVSLPYYNIVTVFLISDYYAKPTKKINFYHSETLLRDHLSLKTTWLCPFGGS